MRRVAPLVALVAIATAAAALAAGAGCTFLVGFDDADAGLGAAAHGDRDALSGGGGDDDSGGDGAVGDDGGGPQLPDEDASDPDVMVVFDDGGDAADAADGNPCASRPNGYPYKSGDALARCCSQVPVRVDTAANCGSCGIACGAGESCGTPVAGHPGCHCATNSQCAQAGYGAASTCYQGYCNCQCPGGNVTCNTECKGGSICHDVSGQNYCSY